MPPRTLVVARHAKSSWKTHESDVNRPLAGRGTRDAVVAGQQLAPLAFDLALVSPAARTRQTWQTLHMGGARAAEVRIVDDLYEATTDRALELVRALPADARTVLVVGHEPTVSELVLRLSAPGPFTEAVEAKFPTMGIAVLLVEGEWADLAEGTARLGAFEVPRG